MTSKHSILQIAISTPLRRAFDYLPEVGVQYRIGQHVQVPFGRRSATGIIIGFAEHSNFPIEKLKKVSAVIDETPLLTEVQLKLYHWASDYYQHPIGDVILGTLPKKIREAKRRDANNTHVACEMTKQRTQRDFQLTVEQQFAIDQITQTHAFKTFLLAGVTGSGKTEVYLQVIEHVLTQQKQALVLVPEIALTPQTVSRFQARFSVPVLLLHSGLSDGKRATAWMQARNNQPCIVIGTRSAVFSPLNQLGVIVVDEAHDMSFKQQSGFRYSACDVAVMRGKLANVPVILGTATPSLESWYNVRQKKYSLLTLPNRVGNAVLPKITLYNVRQKPLKNGLSNALIETMRHHLEQGKQVLFFLNRRGYAPVLMCHHCGWSAKCKQCDARLTLHVSTKKLACHHCGYQLPMMRHCPDCQQSELIKLGVGTEQLEEVLTQLFPNKQIVRVDRDAVKTFAALEKVLHQVHIGKADILLGTQMLVKGHHFENVTLVAAIDVDNGLFSGDFRAIERLGQSLVQVAGRSGRSISPGEVFIQTHHPDHPYLKKLFETDYFAFADALLEDRIQAQLPPVKSMVLLRAESKNEKQTQAFLAHAKTILQNNTSIELYGPLPSAMARKAGFYRSQLCLQSNNRNDLKKSLCAFVQYMEIQKPPHSIRWAIDVDPVEL